MIISIDVGRNQVKAVCGDQELSFKSAVGEWRRRRVGKAGNYEIEINDQKFFVADLAKESFCPREMATESKVHMETKILFLTALSILHTPGEKVKIVTGLPINQHTPEDKHRLQVLLAGLHKVNFQDNVYLFNIDKEDICIAPESGGAFWDEVLDMEGQISNLKLLNSVVRVVDIGSRTVNFCTLEQGDYLDRDSGTLKYGIIDLYNMAENPDSELSEQFARRIVADLSKKWLNYRSSDVILFTGGGSLMLKNWLGKEFKNVIFSQNPIFGNARGFYKMGKADS